jgi:hypothetical protein
MPSAIPPQLYDHLMVFWPAIITALLVPLIVASAAITISVPGGGSVVVAAWIFLLITVFSSTGYTTPNNWIARSIYKTIGPSLESLNWTIKDHSHFDHNRQAIYVWLPHSHFALVPFATIAGGLGSKVWQRPTLLCTAPPFFDIPALRQISMGFGLVRSDYDSMKGSLKQGTSLVVIPGGVREVTHSAAKTIKLVKGRKGFIRLALDAGVPIIPIFSFGENEWFERPADESSAWYHKVLKAMGGGMQFPSWDSVKAWFQKPLEAAHIHIGRPFNYDPGSKAEDLVGLWERHVGQFYKKVRPADYARQIEWV